MRKSCDTCRHEWHRCDEWPRNQCKQLWGGWYADNLEDDGGQREGERMDNIIARRLRGVESKYKDARTYTGQIIISDMAGDAAREIERLEAENTRLRAELEAAKRDIETALGTQRVCFACKNVIPCSNSITGEYGCDPKWRGLCAENGGANG
jgi:hypothetical protein